MKKIRFCSLMVILVVNILLCVKLSIHASTAENEEFSASCEWQNPLYEDIPLNSSTDSDNIGISMFTLEEPEYMTVYEEAAIVLREAMIERADTTTIYYQLTTTEMFDDALIASISDNIFNLAIKHTGNPKEGDSLRWVFAGYSTEATATLVDSTYLITLTFHLNYYTNADQEAELDVAIENLKTELALDGKSDYGIIKAVHDYMVQNIAYDYAGLASGTDWKIYTAYAALVDKTAVCQGYATLFYRLALEYGIDCRIIAGTSNNESHSWNIVKLGDYYYNIDTTWDATGLTNDYFLIGSNNFLDHYTYPDYETAEFIAAYPICENDYGTEDNKDDTTGNGDGVTVFKEGYYYYTVLDGEATIKLYSGTETNVIIPGTLGGYTVTVIGCEAFTNNDVIEKITLPASLKVIENGSNEPQGDGIEDGAFFDCNNLKTVVIPTNSKLHTIGINSFSYCNMLSDITLPDSIRYLNLHCFNYCVSLNEINLPEGVISVAQNIVAFSGVKTLHIPSTCTFFSAIQNLPSLQEITVAESNIRYRAYGGVLYENQGDEGWILTVYPEGKKDTEYTVADYANVVLCDAFLAVDKYVAGEEPYLRVLNIGECDAIGIQAGYSLSRIRCEIKVADTNPYFQNYDGMILSKDGTVLEQVPSKRTGKLIVPEGIKEIAGYACEFSNISEVVVPDSVIKINNSAFDRCYKLEKIIMSSNITELETAVFMDCKALKEIEIPEGVKKIGANAFLGCSSMKNIKIPESVTKMEMQAFANCDNLKSIIIPESITSMGTGTFMGCSSLESVELPDTMVDIGFQSFCRCMSLRSIELPENLLSIPGNAFASCYALETIYIHDKVLSIGNTAFQNCDNLKTVYYVGTEEEWKNIVIGTDNEILDKVTIYSVVEDRVLQEAEETEETEETELDEITVKGDVYKIKREDLNNTTLEYTRVSDITKEKIVIPDTVTIGENVYKVTSVGGYALADNTVLKSITIGNNVTFIGVNAFMNCFSLESVLLPNSITTLDGQTFAECWALKSITIPKNVTSMGSGTFMGCSSLESIELPDTMVDIGFQSFCGCMSLRSIELPENLLSIPGNAFARCTVLETIYIPDKVTSIGDTAFQNCDNLKSVYYAGTEAEWKKIVIGTDNEILDKVTIHYSSEAEDLVIPEIPETEEPTTEEPPTEEPPTTEVQTPETPSNEKPVDKIVAGSIIEERQASYKVNADGKTVEYKVANVNVTSMSVPESVVVNGVSYKVTSIAANAFKNNKKIKTITIGSNVTSIGSNAFSGCTRLTTVKGGKKVTSIGKNAFYNCKKLKSVTIGSKVQTIGNKAFMNCTALTKVTVPVSVKKIGKQAFYNCKKLKTVTIKSKKLTTKNVGTKAFAKISSKATIRVPKNKLKSYKTMLMKRGVSKKATIKK